MKQQNYSTTVHTTKQKAKKALFVLLFFKFPLRCVILANQSFQEFFKEPVGSYRSFFKTLNTRSRTVSWHLSDERQRSTCVVKKRKMEALKFSTMCATLSSPVSVSLTISFLACATVKAVCGLVRTTL